MMTKETQHPDLLAIAVAIKLAMRDSKKRKVSVSEIDLAEAVIKAVPTFPSSETEARYIKALESYIETLLVTNRSLIEMLDERPSDNALHTAIKAESAKLRETLENGKPAPDQGNSSLESKVDWK